MNWEAAGAIGEIVGAIAVVLTIFYLARQVRDNARQVKMNSLTELVSLYNDSFLPIYNSSEHMEIWVRGLRTPDELTEVQREIFLLFVRRLLNPFDTAVSQYLEGTLDEHQFDRYRVFMRELMKTPGGRAYLAAGNTMITADAARLLELEAPA